MAVGHLGAAAVAVVAASPAADRRPTPTWQGGLGFLSLPSEGFAFIVAGLSATQAGVYANQIIVENAAITSFTPKVIIFTLAAVVLGLGPLVVFSRRLVRCRIMGGLEYDGLATQYTRLFHARWIAGGQRSDVLESANMRALADLESTCEVIHHMRPVPFAPMSAIVGCRGSPGADDTGRAAPDTGDRTAEDHLRRCLGKGH